MAAAPDFRIALPDDLDDARTLLKDAGLPFEDLTAESMQDFIVLRREGALLAVGGLECHGDDGLLRSVVVSDTLRGSGLGRQITAAVEHRARGKGIRALYLLTTTAADFFPRLGYARFDRAAVPAGIAQSTEFATICPASATCMKKNLE